ncbi:MAG: hypothetical protein AAF598_13875 [Bacteroidota bacterium]
MDHLPNKPYISLLIFGAIALSNFGYAQPTGFSFGQHLFSSSFNMKNGIEAITEETYDLSTAQPLLLNTQESLYNTEGYLTQVEIIDEQNGFSSHYYYFYNDSNLLSYIEFEDDTTARHRSSHFEYFFNEVQVIDLSPSGFKLMTSTILLQGPNKIKTYEMNFAFGFSEKHEYEYNEKDQPTKATISYLQGGKKKDFDTSYASYNEQGNVIAFKLYPKNNKKKPDYVEQFTYTYDEEGQWVTKRSDQNPGREVRRTYSYY